MPIRDPEIVNKQLQNVEKAGNYWQRNPWAFSVIFMIVCCSVVYGIMNGVNNDLKAERDLYKNKLLERLEQGEGRLNKVEDKLDTLSPKIQQSNEALNQIIIKHNHK